MSSRTHLFQRLRSIVSLATDADRRGVATQDAVAENLGLLEGKTSLNRRELLRGAGVVAAGSLAATIMAPRLAWAKNGGNKASTPDIAIIGAGMAGLACGDAMLAKRAAPTIYEASQRAGGRVFSRGAAYPGFNAMPGQTTELGGEFIDTTHTTMRGYATQFRFAVESVKTNPGEETLVANGIQYSVSQIVDEWRDFVPLLQAELRKSSGGPTADSFSAYDAVLDRTSLRDLLTNLGCPTALRGVLDAAYTGEYGEEIANQSAFNLLLFMHLDKRSKFKPFGVFSDERFHLVGGNQQIPDALAERLDPFIEYGASLVKMARLDNGRYRLFFRNSDGVRTWGSTWTADHDVVVMTLPFSVLRNIELDASLGLPQWKRDAINHFAYGANTKLMIGFNRPTWKDYHASGAGFMHGLPNVMNTWETNHSLATATNAVMTSYSGGNLARAINADNAPGEAAAFLRSIEGVWPGMTRDVRRTSDGKVHAHAMNWTKIPTSLGSYTNNAPGYFTTICGRESIPVGNMFFAGEHTDSFYSWQGFMEGACLSGLAAAKAIVG